MTRNLTTFGLALLLLTFAVGTAWSDLVPMEQLGKNLFFDTDLSTPAGQACAACHAPTTGWVGPVSEINAHGAAYPGAISSRAGGRKPPSAAYATFSPDFYFDDYEGIFVGGMFWDGRALNTIEQAKGPFLNPLEMNNPNMRKVVGRVLKSEYKQLFLDVYMPWFMEKYMDENSIPEMVIDLGDDFFVENAYQLIAESISAYEGSSEVNQFSSKYDAYLAGNALFNPQELFGLQLFEGKAGCFACHPSRPDEEGNPPLFTDFTYDNLGIPKNPENPFYSMPPGFNPDGVNWVDYGLGGRLGLAEEMGKVKVPTLRNVGMRPYEGFVQCYGHNGYFKSLRDIVEFYNSRDVGMWPDPEVPMNVNDSELGNLGLSADEVDAVVAFLCTLTDGWMPPAAPMVASSGAVRILESAPNPFRSTTRLRFATPVTGSVRVRVYDLSGRLTRTLVGSSEAMIWDGRNDHGQRVAPGVYFYRTDGKQSGNAQRVVLLP